MKFTKELYILVNTFHNSCPELSVLRGCVTIQSHFPTDSPGDFSPKSKVNKCAANQANRANPTCPKLEATCEVEQFEFLPITGMYFVRYLGNSNLFNNLSPARTAHILLH